MPDIYDAMERLSSDLSLRVMRLAASRGWGSRPDASMVGNGKRTAVMVWTTVALPGGNHAVVTPRPEPIGSASWSFDVRRTDGRTRPGWLDGISIVRATDGNFILWRKGVPLRDEQLRLLLDELAGP